MTSDSDDRLLDVFLDEVLGGIKPPDLSDRILRALNAPASDAPATDVPRSSPVISPPGINAPGISAPGISAPGISVRSSGSGPTVVPLKKAKRAPGRTTLAPGWVVAAAAFLLISFVGWQVARKGGSGPSAKLPSENGGSSPANGDSSANTDKTNGPRLSAAGTGQDRRVDGSRERVAIQGEPVPLDTATVPFGQEPLNHPRRSTPVAVVPALSDARIVEMINAALAKVWQQHGVATSKPVDDREWCERVFRGLVGRHPSDDEATRFVRDGSANKRAELVDSLLSAKLIDERTGYWSGQLADMWLGSSSRFGNRESFVEYLAQSLRESKSHSQLVRELISATGANQPGTDDYNPAVNFLLSAAGPKALDATAHVSRALLGRQVQCVRCHDARVPGDEAIAGLTQQRFWELNSLLRQMDIEPTDRHGTVRLVSKDFMGEGSTPSEAEIYYENPEGEMRVAYPVLPDGKEMPLSGRLADVDRRQALADWAASSAEVRRAFVNRIWSRMLGFGLVTPVDHVASHGRGVHAELLDALADQFHARQERLGDLTRWISLSNALNVPAADSSFASTAKADHPEHGDAALFSRYYGVPGARELDPVAPTLALLAKAQAREQVTPREQARLDNLARIMSNLKSPAGPGSASLLEEGTPTPSQLAGRQSSPILDCVAASSMPERQKIEHLFLAGLGRLPHENELASAEELLAEEPSAGLSVIWWGIQNSREYRSSQ